MPSLAGDVSGVLMSGLDGRTAAEHQRNTPVVVALLFREIVEGAQGDGEMRAASSREFVPVQGGKLIVQTKLAGLEFASPLLA